MTSLKRTLNIIVNTNSNTTNNHHKIHDINIIIINKNNINNRNIITRTITASVKASVEI